MKKRLSWQGKSLAVTLLAGILVATCVWAEVDITVEIDIKPGSNTNPINLKSRGVIPVAILTTDTFDAWDVDPATLAFGPNGAPIARAQGHAEDVDGDGDLDLVVHFRTQATGIACGDTEVTLTGATFSAQPIMGTDSITTKGC